MCDRREQIPPKRGMADKVGMVLPPTKPSPRRRLSRFAPNPHFSFFLHLLQSPPQAGGDVRPKEANPPQRGGWPTKSVLSYPLPDLPKGEGLVASLREGSAPVFRQSFLTFPQPFRSPYTTAADSAFLCRCGMAFPPYPC